MPCLTSVARNSGLPSTQMSVNVLGLQRKPLIGDIGLIPRKQEKLVNFFVQWGLKHNGMFCMMFGPQPIVVITKGAVAAQILKSSKHSEKSPFYEFIHPWLGLVNSPFSIIQLNVWQKTGGGGIQ